MSVATPVSALAAISHAHRVYVFGGHDADNKALSCTQAYMSLVGGSCQSCLRYAVYEHSHLKCNGVIAVRDLKVHDYGRVMTRVELLLAQVTGLRQEWSCCLLR